MKWCREAEEAVSRVPFFVRKRVKKHVEEEAARCGTKEVTLEHVETCQKRFLNKMEDEVKGYDVETCFGKSGCPNRALACHELSERLEKRLSRKNLRAILKARVKGPLKLHHEFRISVSDCPNACSRPQIVDLGLIGACHPLVSGETCSQCKACIEVCREEAVFLRDGTPFVDDNRCLSCGQCVKVCPTGSLKEGRRGYRVLVGGKLGRHPQLAEELPGIFDLEKVLEFVDRCLDHYQEHSTGGERFGAVLNRTGIPALQKRVANKKSD